MVFGLLLVWAGVSQAQTVTTTTPYGGVESLSVSVSAAQSATGNAYSYSAIRINLNAPGLSFKVSPNNGAAANEVTTQRTSAFVSQENAQIGINTNFFAYNSTSDFFGPYTTDLNGVSASNGVGVSPFQTGYNNALNLSSSNVGTIIRGGINGGYSNTENVSLYNAFSFNNALLINNGVVNASLATDAQARNRFPGIALTSDQRLVLLGNTSINWKEMAQAMIFVAGGSTGLSGSFLDGGGSAALYLRDPNTNSVNALVSSSRYNGSSLAIFAATVPEPSSLAMVAIGVAILLARKHRRVRIRIERSKL